MRSSYPKQAKVSLLFLLAGFYLAMLIASHRNNDMALAETRLVLAPFTLTPYAHLPVIISDPVPTPPPHPSSVVLVPFASGFDTDTITDIANAGDERLFVVQREGVIRIVQPDGTVLPTPFLDIQGIVETENWEQGLLGLVFHPNYPGTPYFYISYTGNSDDIYIVRYSVNPNNPSVADPGSHQRLMSIGKPMENDKPSPVHNGGDLSFGPDGYLYISIGDGGPDPVPGDGIPGDPNNHGQRLGVLLGKILRIDVNSSGGAPPDCGESASHYTIPSNNPFVDGLGGNCDEIWATGLRNPWRFSFDPLTDNMFITDVGEWDREEVNFQAAGAPGGVNYGWHCYEGSLDYTLEYPEIAPDCGSADLYTFPIFEYSGGCSIIGGFIYRGSQYASLYGHYLLADFCSGQIWLLYLDDSSNWASLPAGNTGLFIGAFGQGVDGELYAGTWLPSEGDNKIYHVVVP